MRIGLNSGAVAALTAAASFVTMTFPVQRSVAPA
jgi:hypothetical protein